MSMDDVLDALITFRSCLVEVAEEMAGAQSTASKCFADVSPLWQDEASRAFAEMWNPMTDFIESFLTREISDMDEFLAERLQALEAYLARP